MSKLITTSLISSINWYQMCPNNWREKAYEDLKNQLARKWTTPNKAAQRGIDFEKKIYALLNADTGKEEYIPNLKCSKKFKEILTMCKGGIFQQKNKSFMTVNGIEYCLYGKEDVTFKDKIIDIKTTGNFKEHNYTKSFQHKIYLHNTQKRTFEYIVAIFDGEDSKVIQDVKIISLHADKGTLENYAIDIHIKITEIICFLNKYPELKKLYETKFSR